MRIAQLAPIWLPVPPPGYGGTERIVSYLTEALVSRGHDVTLFATGDSQTKAQLEAFFPKALGIDVEPQKSPLLALVHILECFKHAGEFDIIHSHVQYLGMFFAELTKTPIVHTLHGSFTEEDVAPDKRVVLRRFQNQRFISISNNQRLALPKLNYVATVYNGIPIEEFDFNQDGGDYLAWIGRITGKKGVVDAIKVAKYLNMKLKIAAFIDPLEQTYFEREVKPLIDGKQIEFLGELSKEEKSEFLGRARCLLFPIKWREPFGMVMVESMATGTPVIAYNSGSVPEVVVDSVTGFVVNTAEEMAAKVGQIDKIDRLACRKHVESNFTIEEMVDGYEQAYLKILS